MGKIVGTYYEKKLQEADQAGFRTEKVIKKKGQPHPQSNFRKNSPDTS